MEIGDDFLMWEASIKLELIASYDEVFELLIQYDGVEKWLSQVEKVSEETMDLVVTENASQREPGWQFFDIPKEQKEELWQLGYDAQHVRIGNLRYVQNISQP